MRHNKKFNHLGRKSEHRKAMLANMASSLILHKRINTTLAKAKALRVYVEPLITKSKNDSTHSRRTVFSYLKNKYAVTELFRAVAPKIAERPGGYCRILKTGFRQGDAAEMCFIELVDFNDTYVAGGADKKAAAAGKPRTRRGGGKKAAAGAEASAAPAAGVPADKAAVSEAKAGKTAARKTAAGGKKAAGAAAPEAVPAEGEKKAEVAAEASQEAPVEGAAAAAE